jgi:uncharacterized protein (DUF1697 family)
MTTTSCYIALLRGINVGRAKRIAMADLRKLIADLGFDEVKSLLNSGNVVFTGARAKPKEIAARIEEALIMKVGVTARVTVLGSAELADIMAENSLVDVADEHSRLMVFILTNPKDRARVEPLVALDWGREALAVGNRAVYVWCPEGILESLAAAAVGKALGDGTTARNWNTLTKVDTVCRGMLPEPATR